MKTFTVRGVSILANSQAEAEEKLGSYIAAPPKVPPAPPQPEPEPTAQLTAITSLTSRIDQLEQDLQAIPRPMELPSPDRLEQLAAAIHRTGVLREEILAVGDGVIKSVHQVADAAADRLDLVDKRQAAAEVEIAKAISRADTSVTAAITNADARLKAIEARVTTLRGPVGPTGATGLAGAGCTATSDDVLNTDPAALGERWMGRPLVAGDTFLQITSDGLQVHRWTGVGFDSSPKLVEKTVIASQRFAANIERIDINNSVQAPAGQQTPQGALLPLIDRVGAAFGGQALFKLNAADFPTGVTAMRGFTFVAFFEDPAGSLRVTATITPSLAAGQTNVSDYDLIEEGAGTAWIPQFDLRTLTGGGMELWMTTAPPAGTKVSGWALPLLVKA